MAQLMQDIQSLQSQMREAHDSDRPALQAALNTKYALYAALTKPRRRRPAATNVATV